ncbi:hypothetical protein ABZ235_41375 [Streptomyces canus]|uniref:hypothetical protein n=1 Tax=Streptomyces canus TaxID=58343 RepID=UPI00339DB1BD
MSHNHFPRSRAAAVAVACLADLGGVAPALAASVEVVLAVLSGNGVRLDVEAGRVSADSEDVAAEVVALALGDGEQVGQLLGLVWVLVP